MDLTRHDRAAPSYHCNAHVHQPDMYLPHFTWWNETRLEQLGKFFTWQKMRNKNVPAGTKNYLYCDFDV